MFDSIRLFGFFIFLLTFSSTPLLSQDSLSKAELKHVKQATVLIEVQLDDNRKGYGTGFLIKSSKNAGYFLTNRHLVMPRGKKPETIRVTVNSGTRKSKTFLATIFESAGELDLAVLKVYKSEEFPKPLSFVENLSDLRETQTTYVFGFPFGKQISRQRKTPAITVETEKISSIRKDQLGRIDRIQVGGINPGNSGGPVVNKSGKVIGIARAKIRGTNIGFAIPANIVKNFLQGYVKKITFSGKITSKKSLTVFLHVSVVDPFSNLKNFQFAYVTEEKLKTKPPLEKKKRTWEPVTDKYRKVSLKYNRTGKAYGSLRIHEEIAGKNIIFQISYTGENSERVWSAPSQVGLSALRKKIKSNQKNKEEKKDRTIPEYTPANSSLVQYKKSVEGISVRRLSLNPDQIQREICFSKKSDTFFLLLGNGVLHKGNYEKGKNVGYLPLNCTCQSLDKIGNYLLVVCSERDQLIFIDSDSMKISNVRAIPSIQTVESVAGGDFVGAIAGRNNEYLFLIDSESHQVVKQISAKSLSRKTSSEKTGKNGDSSLEGFNFPVFDRSGNNLYFESFGAIHKLRVSSKEVSLVESSPEIASRPSDIILSPSGKFVVLISGNGNRWLNDTNRKAPPNSTFLFRTKNLNERILSIQQGAFPRALSFSKSENYIFTQNFQKQLLVYNLNGKRKKSLTLSSRGDEVKFMTITPDGKYIFIVTNNRVLLVMIPEKFR